MFNNFVCNGASNKMKVISCMNNDKLVCTCIDNFDRHDISDQKRIKIDHFADICTYSTVSCPKVFSAIRQNERDAATRLFPND